MKYKISTCISIVYFVFACFFINSNVNANDIDAKINNIINDESWSDNYRNSLSRVYKKGPNFNHNDYVFTLGCGGGVICGYIFDSSTLSVVDFPTEFLIDGFNAHYNKGSNKICFSGRSGFNNKKYKNKCYRLISGELVKEEVCDK
ncbi:hypothetical protein [Vibrio gazogenes]|uniref:Uncharacterized protein n=1 Tax=Vibrio gazogenes TaxID=687 RepID=A0A1Z2SIG3_VIBGA|nr:hypothetical protein [Vibrio gazogenes]ASA56961.1 hypothetical protein BSQ33_15490 [Vibrio gazogenes]